MLYLCVLTLLYMSSQSWRHSRASFFFPPLSPNMFGSTAKYVLVYWMSYVVASVCGTRDESHCYLCYCIYVLSYYYICVSSYCYTCVRILLYMWLMFRKLLNMWWLHWRHVGCVPLLPILLYIYILSYYYRCMSSYYYIGVRILLHMSWLHLAARTRAAFLVLHGPILPYY